MSSSRFVPIMILAIVNGMFSPFLGLIFATHGLWYPFFLPAMLPLVLTLSSLLLSTLTLMIGGVPAAIYERFFSPGMTNGVSGFIWLLGVAVLTLPAAANFAKVFGLGS